MKTMIRMMVMMFNDDNGDDDDGDDEKNIYLYNYIGVWLIPYLWITSIYDWPT